MKEIFRIAIVAVALYLVSQYEKDRGMSIDWSEVIIQAIVFSLIAWAWKGL